LRLLPYTSPCVVVPDRERFARRPDAAVEAGTPVIGGTRQDFGGIGETRPNQKVFVGAARAKTASPD
jgi:hypothetical protein